MSKRKANFFGKLRVVYEPNTFIGGVGATYITSASDYVSLSNDLSNSDVVNFSIDNNDNVSFNVNKSYGLTNNSPFPAINSLTYFIDKDSNITIFLGLRDCLNVKHIYLPSLTTLSGQNNFNDANDLRHINLESVTTSNNRFQLDDARNLKKLDLRSLAAITSNSSNGAINTLSKLERLYIGNLTTINEKQRLNNLIRNTGRFPNFYNVGIAGTGLTVYYNSALGEANRQAFSRAGGTTLIGDTIIIDGLTWTAVRGTPSDTTEFDASPSGNNSRIANLVSAISSDNRIGSSSLTFSATNDAGAFVVYCNTSGVIGEAITVETGSGNAGTFSFQFDNLQRGFDVHETLQELKYNGVSTMVEISSPIAVNTPVLNSVVNYNGSNFVAINFNKIADNANGTDGYEVWVDDGSVYRKYFEYDEVFYSGDVIDLTNSVNEGFSIIGSKIKIRAFDGHYNFSEFSNELEIVSGNASPNTFIGGVGASLLPSASDLAIKLEGISTSDILEYNIDNNNNVSCYIPKPYNIRGNTFRQEPTLTYYIDSGNKLINIGTTLTASNDFNFFGSAQFGFLFGNFTEVIGRQSLQGTATTYFDMPFLTFIGSRDFIRNNCFFYFPKVSQVTTQAFVAFGNSHSGSILYLNNFLQTSNNGGINAEIQAYINAGGTVVWILNETPPSGVNDLTVSNITLNSFDLNFTTPASLNGVGFYEVILDDGSIISKYKPYQNINTSGDTVSGLTPNTTYNVSIYTRDIYANKSIISNQITVTTAALPEPNTFVGGVGTIYPTEVEMATKIDVSSSDIINYQVDANNNVSFFVDQQYELFVNGFNGDTDITYYVDLGDNLTKTRIQQFRDTTNFKY